jgi:hypothetical protein
MEDVLSPVAAATPSIMTDGFAGSSPAGDRSITLA